MFRVRARSEKILVCTSGQSAKSKKNANCVWAAAALCSWLIQIVFLFANRKNNRFFFSLLWIIVYNCSVHMSSDAGKFEYIFHCFVSLKLKYLHISCVVFSHSQNNIYQHLKCSRHWQEPKAVASIPLSQHLCLPFTHIHFALYMSFIW